MLYGLENPMLLGAKITMPCFFFKGHSVASRTFIVLSYNVLSDLYETSDIYNYCPPWALSWPYRRQNFLREIVGYQEDTLWLQEVLLFSWNNTETLIKNECTCDAIVWHASYAIYFLTLTFMSCIGLNDSIEKVCICDFISWHKKCIIYPHFAFLSSILEFECICVAILPSLEFSFFFKI